MPAEGRIPGVNPVMERLLRNRGITDAAAARRFLKPSLADLQDPAHLPGAAAAVAALLEAVRTRRPIVIYGDYDVDGVTATAVLFHTLRLLGVEARTYVPDRLEEGYGLNTEALLKLHADGAPLIVSVDCGVSALEPVRALAAAGGAIIVTDHHHVGAGELPAALAIVHPGLPGSAADANLTGVGVAWKLAWALLRAAAGSDKLPDAWRTCMLDCLAFVALGTIADVGTLTAENRALVSFGLKRLAAGPFEGLAALVSACRLENEKITDEKVGFTLAPQINAVGRMGHAREAVELFTGAGGARAAELAGALAGYNRWRQRVQERITDEAVRQVLESGWDRPDHRALVLCGPMWNADDESGWHPGVVGIVASKMVERFHRPAILLCQDGADGPAKGSARSVEGVHLHDALSACAAHLDKFGGHAMAAGMTVKAGALAAFRAALAAEVGRVLPAEEIVARASYDLEAPLSLCHRDGGLALFKEMEQLAPHGPGNRSPRFRVRGTLRSKRLFGNGSHVELMLEQDGQFAVLKAFRLADAAAAWHAGAPLEAVVTPKVNRWQGRESAELLVEAVRVA